VGSPPQPEISTMRKPPRGGAYVLLYITKMWLRERKKRKEKKMNGRNSKYVGAGPNTKWALEMGENYFQN
jgi:hypothetical protein